ncbi:MAG: PilZ domain-containing protein [Halopseudomonas sp.]
MSERRQHPRVPIKLDASVYIAQSEVLTVQLSNLSPGGLMFDVNKALKEQLLNHPREGHDLILDPIVVQIEFVLESDTPMHMRCRLSHLCRTAQDRFEFGFQFIELSAEVEQWLDSFIAKNTGPVKGFD